MEESEIPLYRRNKPESKIRVLDEIQCRNWIALRTLAVPASLACASLPVLYTNPSIASVNEPAQ